MNIVFANLVPRTIAAEKDPSGLGRWVSHLIEGRQTTRTRPVAAYLPCKNTGQKTVYTQQRSYFQALPKKRKDQDKDPIKAWIADFRSEVEGWIEHQIGRASCRER